MSTNVPFQPTLGTTKTLSATSSSSSVTFAAVDVSSTPTPAFSGPSGGRSIIRVYNAGPGVAFCRWGTGAQTAVLGDMPVFPGVVELFSKAGSDDTFAAITATTATIYTTCGEGL